MAIEDTGWLAQTGPNHEARIYDTGGQGSVMLNDNGRWEARFYPELSDMMGHWRKTLGSVKAAKAWCDRQADRQRAGLSGAQA